MPRLLEKRLAHLLNHQGTSALRQIRVGLEREALRASRDGRLSARPHPAALGSALTHPEITTDYSEALLEFVTPALPTVEATLQRLDEIQHFTVRHLGDEMLWNASMPCVLASEDAIPIAEYGTSNVARFKHLYRRGLAYRYGKAMQTISGIHYNFSFDETTWALWRDVDGVLTGSADDQRAFRSRRYFDLIRNVQRYGFLIPYLFGASTTVGASFFGGKAVNLPRFDGQTYYLPHGTSLRLSDLGYSNRKCPFYVSSDSLDAYLTGLNQAMHTPCAAFQQAGVKIGGEYRQLNGNVLQIENEYYSSVRPKQAPQGEETPNQALRRRGVAYVELRMLDVSPFLPTGIDLDAMRFLQAWLTTCFLTESLPVSRFEKTIYDSNVLSVAANGRSDEAILEIEHQPQTVQRAVLDLLEPIAAVCELLGEPYMASLEKQREKVRNPELTPSARMLREMRERGESFYAFACRYSQQHANHYRQKPLAAGVSAGFEAAARESLQRQHALEAADAAGSVGFDDYLAAYFAHAEEA